MSETEHPSIDEALDTLEDGDFSVRETPHGTKLSITTPTGPGYDFTREELMAARSIMGDYEDDVVAVYEAVEEYDGKRREWEVGRILIEADVERLDAVIARVGKGLDLDEEDCEECRKVFSEYDQPPTE